MSSKTWEIYLVYQPEFLQLSVCSKKCIFYAKKWQCLSSSHTVDLYIGQWDTSNYSGFEYSCLHFPKLFETFEVLCYVFLVSLWWYPLLASCLGYSLFWQLEKKSFTLLWRLCTMSFWDFFWWYLLYCSVLGIRSSSSGKISFTLLSAEISWRQRTYRFFSALQYLQFCLCGWSLIFRVDIFYST